MYRGGGGGGVPKGWDGCPTVCADVIGGSFLAFKTPLSAKLNQGVVPYGRFHTKDVFLHAEAKGVVRNTVLPFKTLKNETFNSGTLIQVLSF